MITSKRDRDRFWSKVSVPNSEGCMLWLVSTNRHGYGKFWFRGKDVGAHRMSVIISTGENQPLMEAAHSCRNRHCVAPNHLRWATEKENAYDREKDGTAPIGANNAGSKITLEMATEIKLRYKSSKISQRFLAKEFGISRGHISKIVNDKVWSKSC